MKDKVQKIYVLADKQYKPILLDDFIWKRVGYEWVLYRAGEHEPYTGPLTDAGLWAHQVYIRTFRPKEFVDSAAQTKLKLVKDLLDDLFSKRDTLQGYAFWRQVVANVDDILAATERKQYKARRRPSPFKKPADRAATQHQVLRRSDAAFPFQYWCPFQPNDMVAASSFSSADLASVPDDAPSGYYADVDGNAYVVRMAKHLWWGYERDNPEGVIRSAIFLRKGKSYE